ncbi:MAG: class E sortase [Nitriliruptoraceae bacterium]
MSVNTEPGRLFGVTMISIAVLLAADVGRTVAGVRIAYEHAQPYASQPETASSNDFAPSDTATAIDSLLVAKAPGTTSDDASGLLSEHATAVVTAGTPIRQIGEPAVDPASVEATWRIDFERDGQRLLHDRALHVGEGVDTAALAQGPGRYPGSAKPGATGNVAIAGHRTTHGGPFRNLDRLRSGDAIHMIDVTGTRWTYRVVASEVVTPDEVWVVGPDPLGTGAPTMTLTTCHPKYRASHRLVVWAEHDGSQQRGPLPPAPDITGQRASPQGLTLKPSGS